MSRNELCPCGSGKKFKKCHGAAGKQARAIEANPAAPSAHSAARDEQPASLFKPSLRRIPADQIEDERRKHLKRRSQSSELRGTLVYNTGAAFKNRTG
jgi:hypothetical protein